MTRSSIALAIGLYVCSVLIRFIGVIHAPLQSDEPHWYWRSSGILKRLETEPLQATTHLGHPGVPPALAMAAGQLVAPVWNEWMVVDYTSKYFVDPYAGSRLAVLLLSSLAVPLVFIGAAAAFGRSAGVIGAGLLALDPAHIALSRVAHLDGTLSMLVTSAIFAFFFAVERRNTPAKIVAGALWGLAIATKPTALVLIPIFILYKVIRRYVLTEPKLPESVIAWSDVGAVFAGHVVFAAIYTRFWYHRGELRERLHIRSVPARMLWDTGDYLASHPILLCGLLTTIFCVIPIGRKRFADSPTVLGGLEKSAVALGILVPTLALFPQVYENIARFWTWTFGLSSMAHDAFGEIVGPIPGGYPRLFFTLLPTAAIAGFLLGTERFFRDRSRFALMLLLVVFLWSVPLNVSPKQSWRYALPLVPSLYAVAGYGLSMLVGSWRTSLVAALLIGVQALDCVRIAPWYESYVNPLAIGQGRAAELGIIRPRRGLRQLVSRLNAFPRAPGRALSVSVVGDADSVREEWLRMEPHKKGEIGFGYFGPLTADILVDMPLVQERGSAWDAALAGAEPFYADSIDGVTYLRAYEVPYPAHGTSTELLLDGMKGTSGAYVRTEEDGRALEAIAGHDAVGFLASNPHGVRVPAGNVTVTFEVEPIAAARPEARLGRFEFSSECTKTVRMSDFSGSEPRSFAFTCPVEESGRFAPRFFWPGEASVRIRRIALAF